MRLLQAKTNWNRRWAFLSALLAIAVPWVLILQAMQGRAAQEYRTSSKSEDAPTQDPRNQTDNKLQLYDSGDPNAEEQFVLELANRARKDPDAEGKRLDLDIREGLLPEHKELVGPRPPLAMNKTLLEVAREHSKDMSVNSYMKHEDLKGQSPDKRIKAAGYEWTTFGENIVAESKAKAQQLGDFLMIDKDVPNRGHRVNLLNLIPNSVYREVGVGIFHAKSPNKLGLRDFMTEDFGSTDAGPFILGVAYRDKNSNKFYDPGEGIAGVRIEPDRGSYYAITSRSGGYAFPCKGGQAPVKLKATWPGLPKPIEKEATISEENVKVDFVVAGK